MYTDNKIDKNKITELIYDEYNKFTINLIKEGTDPLQCAGVMMAQALQHYKSLLNAEEYNKMVKLMADSKDSVKAFIRPTLN
tara:strand:+ start:1257 stop:1502 length:246 start_codon:yes stop_codon:yes gene_type:complete